MNDKYHTANKNEEVQNLINNITANQRNVQSSINILKKLEGIQKNIILEKSADMHNQIDQTEERKNLALIELSNIILGNIILKFEDD